MLHEIRINKGIKQIFVANKLGISRHTFSRIEQGEIELPAKYVPILADLYGMSYEEIIKTQEGK